jgi:hypothetical protein
MSSMDTRTRLCPSAPDAGGARTDLRYELQEASLSNSVRLSDTDIDIRDSRLEFRVHGCDLRVALGLGEVAILDARVGLVDIIIAHLHVGVAQFLEQREGLQEANESARKEQKVSSAQELHVRLVILELCACVSGLLTAARCSSILRLLSFSFDRSIVLSTKSKLACFATACSVKSSAMRARPFFFKWSMRVWCHLMNSRISSIFFSAAAAAWVAVSGCGSADAAADAAERVIGIC